MSPLQICSEEQGTSAKIFDRTKSSLSDYQSEEVLTNISSTNFVTFDIKTRVRKESALARLGEWITVDDSYDSHTVEAKIRILVRPNEGESLPGSDYDAKNTGDCLMWARILNNMQFSNRVYTLSARCEGATLKTELNPE